MVVPDVVGAVATSTMEGTTKATAAAAKRALLEPLNDVVFSFALFPGPKPGSFPYSRDSTIAFVTGMRRRFRNCSFVAHLHDAVADCDIDAIVAASGSCACEDACAVVPPIEVLHHLPVPMKTVCEVG